MRVRSTVYQEFGSTGEPREFRTRSCSGNWGSWSVTSPPGQTGVYQAKTITDVEVPRFHSLLRCGKFLPLNPCTIETVTRTLTQSQENHLEYKKSCQNNGKALSEERGLNYQYTGSYYLPIPEVPEAVITAVVNAAVADSRAHVFDALTFLGEFAETQRMFKHNLSRFELGVNKLIRKASKYRGPRSAKLQALAGLWLEWRYGWTPLVYSLRDIRARIQGRTDTIAKGRGYQTISISDSKVTHESLSNSDVSITSTISGQHIVRGWAASDIGNPFADSGFDPLVTAYELTTLSFVLDWFVQYGTWIQAVSPFQAGQLLGSCASIKTEVTRTALRDRVWRADSSGNLASGTYSFTEEEHLIRYTRFAASTGLPGWNPRITPKRFIDAIALAFGMRGRIQASITRM